MASKLKTDILETVSGSGTIALTNQLSGMTSASVPSGSVIQVTNNTRTHADNLSTTSATYIDSGLVTGAITPLSAGSKISVNITGFFPHVNANGNRGMCYQMFKSVNGGTYVKVSAGSVDGGFYDQADTASWYDFNGACVVFDTPTYSLGQTINYKLYYKHAHSSSNSYINHIGGVLHSGNNTVTTLITMTEIKG